MLKLLLVAISPVEYGFLLVLTAGILSKPFQKGIVKGTFPRKTAHPVYAMRKLYNTCWTSFFYFKPLYNAVLNIPAFRAMAFRLFGYKGSLNVNIAPDAWIRDLPLLRLEEDAYVANRATLGTNICMMDGSVIVGNVTLKKRAMVGHLSMLAVGVTIGERSEVGVGTSIGLHAKIGNDTVIGGGSMIGHYSKIGSNTHLGWGSFIGDGARIGDNLNLPKAIRIPDKVEINTVEDIMKYATDPMTLTAITQITA